MTRRAEQLNSVVHRAVQAVLTQGFGDPRLEGSLITVTQVRVTEDLRIAVVGVSIMPANREARALAGLKAATKNIRHRAARLVDVQRLPEFVFKLDRSAKREADVLHALDAVRQEWAARGDAPTTDSKSEPCARMDAQENEP
ncbi:MAG: ribosome-binding factor A [Phycisphaerales bacterium]|nr:ribosome-binding factor A [Phycisphaerales bacterium]